MSTRLPSNEYGTRPRMRVRWPYLALFIFAVSLVGVLPGRAEMYKYTDENGKTHFTDDLSKIPRKYRSPDKGLGQIEEDRRPPVTRRKTPGKEATGPAKEYVIQLTPVSGGNFMVDTYLNDRVRAKLMLDTGASMVTLTQEVAKKLNMKTGPNTPKIPFSTANGVVWSPVIALDTMRVGEAEVEMVEASINSGLGDHFDGLLGMSFLNDYTIEINRGQSRMVLKTSSEPGELLWGGKPGSWWRSKFDYYRARIKEYKRQSDQMTALGSPYALSMKNMVKFYQKLRSTLRRKAMNAGLPEQFM